MKGIILAGGFGTRLRPVIGDDMPKCMAPVMGKPMVSFVIAQMKRCGIKDITLALHYKAEKFIQYFGDTLKYSFESTPLGTGGAIKNCISGTEPVAVANGDTVCPVDYNDMLSKHTASITVAVMPNGESAGVYIINPDVFDKYPANAVLSFERDVLPNTDFTTYTVPFFTDLGTPESYLKCVKEWV